MKKILTSIAMALLLMGCAKQYDDSAIQTRIADLERRVTSLESSVDALRSAIGEGVYVVKVQEYADPDTGKVIGVTVTYSNGDVKYFEITPKVDYAGPVVSIIKNGAGDLVWAVDGVAIKDGNGKDVTVYQTPVFTIDGDGNLLVSIDGSDPVVLGQVQNEGATLVDGIFTDIKVMEDKIVLTLSDNSLVNIPYTPFKLNIETTDFVFEKKGDVIEIPYTITGGTAAVKVEVAGYNPNDFFVEVTADKILVTPLVHNAAAVMSVWAKSEAGLFSIERIEVNHEEARVLNPNADSIVTDFIVESDGGTLVAKVVSNVEIEAVPDDESGWITIVDTKAWNEHTITMSIAAHSGSEARDGCVNLYKKGTNWIVESIYIMQNPVGPKNLSKDGTANSYIVTSAGNYKFKTVKGNSSESVGTVASAELLWETVNTATAPEVNSIIASVSYADDYITFSTPATLKAGNALIAAKDANGVILWSWHIWIPETEVGTVVDEVIFGSQAIMDRNLGALVAAPADAVAPAESFGLFYEWGRKDPFPGHGAVGSDGAAALAGTQMTNVNGTLTIAQSIETPTLYAWNSGDWCDAADANTKLWDKTKTIYDPCPAGYMVPTRDGNTHFWGSTELNALDAADNFVNNGATLFSLSIGTSTAVVFPYAGYIDNDSGAHYKSGKRTAIWSSYSSTAGKAYARDLRHDSSSFKRTELKNSRAASVRCVLEPVSE